MKCKKCGHEEFEIKEKGIHHGLYCKSCGAWLKWLPRDEVKAYTKPAAPKDKVVYKVEISTDTPCNFCGSEIVVPTAWGDGGIVGWFNVPCNFCPVCGRPAKGVEEV